MNKISCFAVSKITNAVKGNKTVSQNNDENHDYTNSVSANASSGGTPLIKRNSKVSSVPDIEVIQEVIPQTSSNVNVHSSLTHLTSMIPINQTNQHPSYVNQMYLQHHQQLSQPSSPMLPPSQMSHHRNYNNPHYKISAPSSPQLTPRCNSNFYPFPSSNCSANNTSTAINEMLNMKHRQYGSRTSIPPSSPSLSHQACKSPSRHRKYVNPYSNEVMNGYSTMEVRFIG